MIFSAKWVYLGINLEEILLFILIWKNFFDTTNNEVISSLGDTDILPLFYQHTDKIAIYQIGELEQ